MIDLPPSTVLESKELPMALVDTSPSSFVVRPGQAHAQHWREWHFTGARLPGILIFLYSALLGLGAFALNGRYGLNLADEGYLRYGVHAIMNAGQVPIRDFQSYDPGRYYWVAAWSLLLGDGILSTRLACALFQVLGLGVALLALRKAGVRWWMLGLIGLIITFWMVERFKLFEQCVSLIALYPAVCLIQRPNTRNALLAGVFVGLAAFMGRNHGVYNVVAFGALIMLLTWKHHRLELLRLLLPWGGGIVLGYLPMLLMLAFVPGFFAAFVESLQLLAHAKSTNVSLPVPWPWSIQIPEDATTPYFFWSLATAWCFVLLAGGFALAAAVVLRMPERLWRGQAGLVAATLIGLPYAHYAFSRADTPHLAHSMPLLVVALLLLTALLPSEPGRKTAALSVGVGLGVLTYFGTYLYNPIVASLTAPGEHRCEVSIGGQTLSLNPAMGKLIADLQRFARTKMAADDNVLIAPFIPTLYEVVARSSPVHEIYFLWPAPPPEAERAEIADMERNHVKWVVLGVKTVDNNLDNDLAHTHPLLTQYIRSHFRPFADFSLPRPYLILHRISPEPVDSQQ